jgi:hypothetical protein
MCEILTLPPVRRIIVVMERDSIPTYYKQNDLVCFVNLNIAIMICEIANVYK